MSVPIDIGCRWENSGRDSQRRKQTPRSETVDGMTKIGRRDDATCHVVDPIFSIDDGGYISLILYLEIRRDR